MKVIANSLSAIFLIVGSVVAGPYDLPSRQFDWQSNDGRTMKAGLVSFQEGAATYKLANGKVTPIKDSLFDPSSRARVAKFRLENELVRKKGPSHFYYETSDSSFKTPNYLRAFIIERKDESVLSLQLFSGDWRLTDFDSVHFAAKNGKKRAMTIVPKLVTTVKSDKGHDVEKYSYRIADPDKIQFYSDAASDGFLRIWAKKGEDSKEISLSQQNISDLGKTLRIFLQIDAARKARLWSKYNSIPD